MRAASRRFLAAAVALAAVAVGLTVACAPVRRQLVSAFTPTYRPVGDPTPVAEHERLKPEYEGRDLGRPQLAISLLPVGRGFTQPTDVQFVPGSPELAVVLEKGGAARWLSLRDGATGPLLEVEVLTASEEGLLGLAFHPDFVRNGRFFLNYVAEVDGKDTTRIAEWRMPPGAPFRTTRPVPGPVLLEVRQPYQNHNGGQLAFGPDGLLYVGLGDGGFRGDPHDHGQNPGVLLGKLLRIGVDPAGGLPYTIPADNPFVGIAGHRPELWALGLRNPWRFSFDPAGRLFVADVGQDRFEEIDLVERGGNYGWNAREGRHCFEPEEGCRTEGLIDPIYEYDREDGQSITGGHVYRGSRIPALTGKYVFADFVRGRLFAIDPPATAAPGPLANVYALGRFPLLPSTFGEGPDGELYLADFASGTIYRLDPAATTAPAPAAKP